MPSLRFSKSNARPTPQHSDNSEILVEFGPMNAHRHQFEMPARRGAGVPQQWIPYERGRDPAAIRKRYHQLVGGEGNRDRPDIADINFQSAHAISLHRFVYKFRLLYRAGANEIELHR